MLQQFSGALQDLHIWDELSLDECEEIARFIATLLPRSFHFVRVETYQVGSQRHSMALFEWSEPSQELPCSFVLIPGGTFTLGYDQSQGIATPEDLVREWQSYQLGYYRDLVTTDGDLVRDILPINYEAFYKYLSNNLLPLRTVTLKSFLIETVAHNVSDQLPPPVMRYRRFKSEWGKQGYVTYVNYNIAYTVPHRHVVAFLKQQGFRLPSSDEWEYACSAGSRTLFYWGNWEFLEEEQEVEDFQAGEQEEETNVSCNAFGLEIAYDEYNCEYCSNPAIMRGGDGGAARCGFSGTLAGFLPLASTYYLSLSENDINNGVDFPYFRRVFDLTALLE